MTHDGSPPTANAFGERDLATHLRAEPTRDEHSLVEQIGLHNGAAVPAHMFCKLVLIVHELKAIADRILGAWRLVRWIGVPLIGAVLTNATCLGKAAYEAHDARVAAEQQRIDDQRASQVYRETTEKEIAELRLDVRELRSMLRKMSGADPGPVSSTSEYADLGINIVKR